jgi:hypothetical protein
MPDGCVTARAGAQVYVPSRSRQAGKSGLQWGSRRGPGKNAAYLFSLFFRNYQNCLILAPELSKAYDA